MSKQDDAQLILKLYELRREDRMRDARSWFIGEFFPRSTEDFAAALAGDRSPLLRMVVSYWDMACGLVLHGAIDPEMFSDTNGEHVVVYAKLEPFLSELRAISFPSLAANLEKVVKATPGADQTIQRWQQRWKDAAANRTAASA